ATQAAVAGTKAYTNGTTQALTAAGSFTVNGYSFSVNSGDTVQQVMDKINAASGSTGVSASFGSTHINLSSTKYGSDQTINLTDSGATLLNAAGTSTAAGVDAVATVTYNYGTNTATASFTSGKGLQLKDTYGNVINLTTAGGTA